MNLLGNFKVAEDMACSHHRQSHLDIFYEKDIFENFSKLTGKSCPGALCLIKLQVVHLKLY